MNNRVNYAGFLDLVIETVKETEPDLHDTIPSATEFNPCSRAESSISQTSNQES